MEKYIFNNDISKLMGNKKRLEEVFVTNTLMLNEYTTRNSSLKGQDYLVVPVVMIVEGVLNRIRYAKDDMWESASLWNGVPLVLNHPEDGFSANRREILEDFGLGQVLNTRYDEFLVSENEGRYKGRLSAEAWFNIEETKRLAPDLYGRLISKDQVEVSTGLIIDVAYADNSYYEGNLFEYLSSNYKPDHLAILPNDLGACSIADGCGIREILKDDFQINSNYKENGMELQAKMEKLVANSVLEKNDVAGFSEEKIDALLAVHAEEEVEVEAVVEEAVAEVEADEVEAEVEDEVVVEETNAESEAEVEAEAEVEESEAEVEAEVEEQIEINSVEELFSKVKINSELKAKIEAGNALVAAQKEEAIEGILSKNTEAFSKEELNQKTMEELGKINKLVSAVNYGIAASAPAKKAVVQGLSLPSFDN